MTTFLITYDLASAANKHAIATAIMAEGEAWARPLDQTWYVRAQTTADQIEQRLAHLIGDDDALIVQEIASTVALANTTLRWFRKRTGEAPTNIVAFPSFTARPLATGEMAELADLAEAS